MICTSQILFKSLGRFIWVEIVKFPKFGDFWVKLGFFENEQFSTYFNEVLMQICIKPHTSLVKIVANLVK